MSFDVVSLFTSIPVDLAVQIAAVRLENDQSLHERTSLSAKEIIELLEFCLKSTEFLFRGSYYKQIHGTAIDSPVSVIVANLVMEELENNALSTFTQRPRLYYRFVDDTIAALKKTEIPKFHKHLNDQNVHIINFTVERYKKDGISFLDTLNRVNDDGSICTKVYRKPRHSERDLQFDWHHPVQHKRCSCENIIQQSD